MVRTDDGDRTVPWRQVRLPSALPGQVGIVCTRDSEGHHEFVQVLERSGYPIHASVKAVPLHGHQVAQRIVESLRELEREGVDVIALVRPGGLHPSLAPFNHEKVVEAVARCRIPVVCALGGEGEPTLCDEFAAASYRSPAEAAAKIAEKWYAFKSRIQAQAHQCWAAIAHARTARHARDLRSRILVAALLLGSTAAAAIWGPRSFNVLELGLLLVAVGVALLAGWAFLSRRVQMPQEIARPKPLSLLELLARLEAIEAELERPPAGTRLLELGVEVKSHEDRATRLLKKFTR